MPLSATAANAALDAAFTGPVYLGLFVGASEVTGGGYARKLVTFAAASSGLKKNNVQVDFDVATAAWGTVNGWALYSAASGGTALDSFPASIPPVTIGIGDQKSVAVNTLVLGAS